MEMTAETMTDTFETVFNRQFNAPRALVYNAFTDPAMLAQWFGPRGFDVPRCETDLRPGGRMLIVMRGSDGIEFPIDGIYREVRDGELISYTNGLESHPEAWHDMVNDLRGTPRGTAVSPPLTTVTFADKADGTLVTIKTTFINAADRDAFSKMQMRAGWAMSLDKLAELAITGFTGEGNREIIMTHFMKAPIELVWEAFSKVDRISDWWGPQGYTTTPETFDFRVGGEWRHVMHGPDGTDYPNRTLFREIVRHERIVYDCDSGIENDPHKFTSTISFRAIDGGTEITMHLVMADAQQRQIAASYGAVELGYQTLFKLEAYVTGT
jgi:uncharacterized protein YndB with AHSA1/START domain